MNTGEKTGLILEAAADADRRFYPADSSWTKRHICEVVNRIVPLIEETDRRLTPYEILDEEAQAFVDLNQKWMEDLAGALEYRGMDDDRAELLIDWVNNLINRQDT